MTGKKSPKSWEYAIEVLRHSAYKLAKTARELYPILKFSYDNLPSDIMRSCLLYCCLFPEDHRILKSSLIEYWFCEGLLDVFENISQARLQGYDIIDSLINASLLEQVGQYHVKMHDVIRDMALWISCECEATEKKYYVQAGLQLTEAPEVGKWEGMRRLSFMKNQIKCLISTPTCPNLQTLFLSYNLRSIENGFFQCMPHLRVLKLSYCKHLRELPKGVSKLVSLECLDLSATGIQELPIELRSLSKLKCLNLEGTENLIRVPCQLISRFSKLQVFRISNRGPSLSLDKKEESKILIGGEDEGLIEDLGRLQHLYEICIEMKCAFALERFLRIHNLQECTQDLRLWNFSKYEVFNVLDLTNMKSLRRLSLYFCESVKQIKIERKSGEGRIFHNLQFVHLSSCTCDKLRDMTWLIHAPNLRSLQVFDCVKMKEIMNKQNLDGNASQDPFPKLENLWLRNLLELKSIYWNALPFLFLKRIHVQNCSKLKKLPFNSNSVKGNNLYIEGERVWWGELEWEDEATRNAFSSSFKGP